MLIFEDGKMYQGYFKEGKREYEGRIFNSDKTYYEGGMKQDKKHGKGEFQWEDGKRLVGTYEDGFLHGKCTIFNADGTKEEHEYDHGVEIYY